MNRLYNDAALYERIHREGTAEEARLLLDLFELHGNGGRRWLEPACGTGRLLEALARKGYEVAGYDASKEGVAYAQKRLKKYGDKAAVVVGDLVKFKPPRLFDAAFCLIGTIRHLMTDKDMLAHLKNTAAALRPGGIYIVGLDIVDYDLACDDEESWDGHFVLCLAPDRKTRRERVLNFMTTPKGVVESSYDLRSYDLKEWRALIKKSPFKILDEELYPRAELPVAARSGLFVLKA